MPSAASLTASTARDLKFLLTLSHHESAPYRPLHLWEDVFVISEKNFGMHRFAARFGYPGFCQTFAAALPSYFGKALAVVQAGREPGVVIVTVEAEGIPTETLQISSK